MAEIQPENRSNPGDLGGLIETIKHIPRDVAASATHTSIYIPALWGIYPLMSDGANHLYGKTSPTLMEYGFDVGLAALGIYATYKISKPLLKKSIELMCSGKLRHLRERALEDTFGNNADKVNTLKE